MRPPPSLAALDTFADRHLGPREEELPKMLGTLGLDSMEALVRQTVPESIRRHEPLALDAPRSESEVLAELRALARQNDVFRSFLGMGYHDCLVPAVIQRNVLENPGWYTQYTPYQPEISQGRLEALLNFQTVVADLTGLPIAGASLLDEATAAAEAMHMCRGISKGQHDRFLVAKDCHPQTIAVVQGRGRAIGIEVVVCDLDEVDLAKTPAFGALLQYPTTDGRVVDPRARIDRLHAGGALVVVATDLLALTLLVPPGELGADIAVGSTQRFGVPMGFGGPHAAFLSAKDEHRRHLPGRIIGASKDAHGKTAYRLALQTREQHIRREKATSNICTAQVLLAVMASMYAVYHGPKGLRRIAERVHALAGVLAAGLRRLGMSVPEGGFFDTLRVRPSDAASVLSAARARRMNLRDFGDGTVGVALDEATTAGDLSRLLEAFAIGQPAPSVDALAAAATPAIPEALRRKSDYLTHPVFHRFHAEHELLRYLRRLEAKDLSLTTSMIPLGSCTMKLNATTEMFPVSWPELASLHPFAPAEQTQGYQAIFRSLEGMLAEITGLPGVSLQPNAGSQGEYAGLLVIRAYHESRGDRHRNVCLIPVSAHGTNPASAVMAGFQVVVVACDAQGNVDLEDLRAKARQHGSALGALMLTYPSTHGVFEESVRDVCAIVHAQGGQVYMDGANMNAQVGLCRPGDIGADVCHLNLHKTFCIPHGGGGPGMGPICAAKHLQPFLPGHPVVATGGAKAIAPVSAAPYGSPSILPISWTYIRMMGAEGLRRATEVAILNANYMAGRLDPHYPVLYEGRQGRVAHEFIIDLRPVKASAGIEAEDVAKRLMDYGFHAPTMSFPVPGTLMIEPTESESKAELDRFCDAMIAIREEIRAIEQGKMDRQDNPLKNAPHTAAMVTGTEWPHPYSREQAAFPAPWLRDHKYWPAVSRVDNAYGDRNLVCTCLPTESTGG